MKTRRLMIVAIVLLLAAIAANVPRAWFFGVSAQERTSQVLSEFINLGSDPPESLIKADWLVRNERLKLLRERRLAHVPSDLITVYAEDLGITEAALRARLTDPLKDDPFETAHAALILPQDAPHGQNNALSWAYVASVLPEGPAPQDCGLWLIVWDADGWFYAPLGTARAERLLQAAMPKRAPLFLQGAPRC